MSSDFLGVNKVIYRTSPTAHPLLLVVLVQILSNATSFTDNWDDRTKSSSRLLWNTTTHPTTRHHIPKHSTLHSHCHQHLRFHKQCTVPQKSMPWSTPFTSPSSCLASPYCIFPYIPFQSSIHSVHRNGGSNNHKTAVTCGACSRLIVILPCVSGLDTGFGLRTGFTERLWFVTAKNYNAIANLHTSQITVAHTISPSVMPSLAIDWLNSSLSVTRLRLLTMQFLLFQCSCPHWIMDGSQLTLNCNYLACSAGPHYIALDQTLEKTLPPTAPLLGCDMSRGTVA